MDRIRQERVEAYWQAVEEGIRLNYLVRHSPVAVVEGTTEGIPEMRKAYLQHEVELEKVANECAHLLIPVVLDERERLESIDFVTAFAERVEQKMSAPVTAELTELLGTRGLSLRSKLPFWLAFQTRVYRAFVAALGRALEPVGESPS